MLTIFLFVLPVILSCSGSSYLLDLSNNFQQMLSCFEQRNITILIHSLSTNYFDKFFELLQELINNEFCYIVSIYLPFEDRVIKLRKETNMNHIESSFDVTNKMYATSNADRTMDLIEQYYNDTVLFSKDYFTMEQTFVYIFDAYSYHSRMIDNLQRLWESGNWKVIFYTTRFDEFHQKRIIPFHNIVFKRVETFMDLSLRHLIDVIKELDFNRYDFKHLFDKGFFNHTCFRGITKIHIAMDSFDDLYLPMAFAILDKENQRRQKEESLGPLEIIFYITYVLADIPGYPHKAVKFSTHWDLQFSH